MKRQEVRKLLLLISLLLFPITIYYLSPYLIITGAMEGIINGSFIIFVLMLIGSIFFGRLFCGYLCPVGGLLECTFLVNDKAPKQGWKNFIKYIIWIVWIVIIVLCFINKGKIIKVDFFYLTEHGISISNISDYVIYYVVVLLMFVPSVIFGKRIACHYFCWMAPFMIIGTKIRNMIHLPGLHITADASKCISCKKCNKNCPMSLDVANMVQRRCNDSECILCGACVDSCPRKVLQYKIKNDKINYISHSQEVQNGK
jgi:ferredoxin-type protein NapH